jgi:hypothetical protein
MQLAASWLLFPLGLMERKLRLSPKRKNYFTDALLYIVAQKPAAASSRATLPQEELRAA